MCDSLLDGSYWSKVSPRRSRSVFAKKQPLVFPVDLFPKRRKSKPSQPLTAEQKLLAKEKRDLKRKLEKSKIEEEHKRNEEKQKRKFEGIILFDKILLGGKLVAKNDDLLRESDVVAVLNVTSSVQNYFEEDGKFVYRRISVIDSCSENIELHFPEAIEFINQHASLGKRVLVHCEEGQSRSPTIVIAWMMKDHNTNLKDSYTKFTEFVGEEFFHINDGFKKQLMNCDMMLYNCHSTDFLGSRTRTPTRKLELNNTPSEVTMSESPKKPRESPRKVTGFKRQRLEKHDDAENYGDTEKHGDTEKYDHIEKLGDAEKHVDTDNNGYAEKYGDIEKHDAEKYGHIEKYGDAEKCADEAKSRADDAESSTGDTEKRASEAESHAGEAEKRASAAEKRAARAENRATKAENRASEAENRASEAEKRASDAEKRASEAEIRASDAEKRAHHAEKRSADAEKRAHHAEKRAVDTEKRAIYAEKRTIDAEKRAVDNEKRAAYAEKCVDVEKRAGVQAINTEITTNEEGDRANTTEKCAPELEVLHQLHDFPTVDMKDMFMVL